MRLGDLAGDVEAHADANWTITSCVIGARSANERVKYLRQLSRWDMVAAVVNPEDKVYIFASQRERHGKIGRTVLDGIAEQVGNRLADAIVIPHPWTSPTVLNLISRPGLAVRYSWIKSRHREAKSIDVG